jgi:hypothetical protein
VSGSDRPSSRPEFREGGFDRLFAPKTTFSGGAQAAIDAGKFFRSRPVFAVIQAGIKFKRKLGELVLDIGRPCLDPLQNLCQFRCLHGAEASTKARGCQRRRPPKVEATVKGPSVIRSKQHDAGQARGHASLMGPAKPDPGVSSVALGRYCADPDVFRRSERRCFEGGVIEPPSAVDTACRVKRLRDGPPVARCCQDGTRMLSFTTAALTERESDRCNRPSSKPS